METNATSLSERTPASEIPSQLISTPTVFETAYEISLAAQCAVELGPQASRYALFNAFTRKRLQQAEAIAGFRVLESRLPG